MVASKAGLGLAKNTINYSTNKEGARGQGQGQGKRAEEFEGENRMD